MSTKNLWAPWRSEYVGADRPEGCFFCAAAMSPQDPQHLVVGVGEGALVMLNRFPYASGHLMVAPVEHTGQMEQVGPALITEIWRLVIAAKRALDDLYHPEGYNVGWNLGEAAGAGVTDHLDRGRYDIQLFRGHRADLG